MKFKAILYTRVSTVHDEQTESIENQMLLAKKYLTDHPDIELAEPLEKYSERVSGKTDNRPKFKELCERLSQGDIKYLMIKDLKRLSRSVETTYAFFNLMKLNGFEIILLSTGNIIDSTAFEEVESNLLLGIEALFAQNTVLTQSRYGKTVQKVRCDNKRLVHKDATLFGYEWDVVKNDVVIVEEKALIIRELFNRYVFRNQGTRELRVYLSSLGYHYSAVTVSKWLQESKYIGDWTINRKGSTLGIGQGAKSHRFTREKSEWVHVYRPDLAIVDKEIFDLAQEIRQSRVRTYAATEGIEKSGGNFRGKHLFAGKLFCAECGSSYRFKWADRNKTVAVYYDSFKERTGNISKACPNVKFKRVYENDIIDIVVAAIHGLNIKGKVSIERLMDSISNVLRTRGADDREVVAESKRLKKLEREAEKISNSFIEANSAMRERLNTQLERVESLIEECKAKIQRFSNRASDEDAVRQKLSSIQDTLSGWIDVSRETLNKSMVDKLILRITIDKSGMTTVLVKPTAMFQFQLNPPPGSQAIVKTERWYSLPSKEEIEENLRKLHEGLEGDQKGKIEIGVVGFTDDNHEDGLKAKVMVDIDFGDDDSKKII